MNSKFILSTLIITISQLSYSINFNLNFSYLTVEEGLSSNTIHCVFQDSKGFMWFGTDDGLNMFDGYEIKKFNTSFNDSLSLSGNSVHKIIEDSQGRLWIATNNGIDIFRRDRMSFDHVPLIQSDTLPFQNYVREIMEDNRGNILISTTVDIYILDTSKHSFVRFINNCKEYDNF